MKKILLGAIATAALSSTAFAADLPARTYTKAPAVMASPVYDWSGFYIGLNGGGGWSRKCWDHNNPDGTFVAPAGCHNANGGIVGGQVGYRWQSSSWVFGLEAQGDWANLKGSNISLVNPLVTNQTKIDALGLFTGQIGYAWNNVLWYLKGGAAVAHDKYYGIGPLGGVFDGATETRWGGAVGTGIEFGFARNWSFALEYDHAFLGSRTLNLVSTGLLIPAGTFSRSATIRQDVDMVTARINYTFGGPVVAKY
jgi:outer membrane immunogenic protein